MFFTWKSQLEGVATSDKQVKKVQRYHGLTITHNVLSTSNPSDTEINVAVYTMKKNLIAILHHSIQAGDSAKKHRFVPLTRTPGLTWIQVKFEVGYLGILWLYVRRAFVVFGILHDVTLKDHSLKSLSFQLEVFVILITNYISFVTDFLYHSL